MADSVVPCATWFPQEAGLDADQHGLTRRRHQADVRRRAAHLEGRRAHVRIERRDHDFFGQRAAGGRAPLDRGQLVLVDLHRGRTGHRVDQLGTVVGKRHFRARLDRDARAGLQVAQQLQLAHIALARDFPAALDVEHHADDVVRAGMGRGQAAQRQGKQAGIDQIHSIHGLSRYAIYILLPICKY
jgi:hypothetical protein